MCSAFQGLRVGADPANGRKRPADAGSEDLRRSDRDRRELAEDPAQCGDMTLDELCQAALQVIDNTAGNLLLKTI
jgi:beta-lactamase class A